MRNDFQSILLEKDELEAITTRLSAEINRDYAGSDRDILFVCILKGAAFFACDLAKKITLPLELDFMRVSSYGNSTSSSGVINILQDVSCPDLSAHNVIIVDDIMDTGRTLSYLKSYLEGKGAVDVKICSLLNKPSRRTENIAPDYCGADIPNVFVAGYGLDFAEKYRNATFVGVLKHEIFDGVID